MKLSHTMGMAAGAALLAVSGIASAVTTYQTSGYIVQSTCGSLSPTLAAGSAQSSTVVYPGQGAAGMILVSPAALGPGTVSICTTTQNADLTGGSMSFTCYSNSLTTTTTTIPTSGTPLSSTFTGAATSVNLGTATAGAAINVESVSTLPTGPTTSCSFTTDATWTAE